MVREGTGLGKFYDIPPRSKTKMFSRMTEKGMAVYLDADKNEFGMKQYSLSFKP